MLEKISDMPNNGVFAFGCPRHGVLPYEEYIQNKLTIPLNS